jgi:hypothetical protein
MIELATKAFDAAMRRLIIWCRNEWQKEVKRAQEDPDNQQLMRQIQQEEKIKKDKRELIVAGVVEDPMDIIDIPIAHGKRTRKPVQWYRDINWDDNGKAILDEDANEGSKKQHQCLSPTIVRLPGRSRSRSCSPTQRRVSPARSGQKNVPQGGPWSQRYTCTLWHNRFSSRRTEILRKR